MDAHAQMVHSTMIEFTGTAHELGSAAAVSICIAAAVLQQEQ
jgi:hypothetical protein